MKLTMKYERHCHKPMLCSALACVMASVLPTLQSLQPNSSNIGIADVDKGWTVEAKWHITSICTQRFKTPIKLILYKWTMYKQK